MRSQLIDEKVTLTMIVCCVLSLMALAFRYKSSEPDYPINIGVTGGTLYTDAVISFTASGKNIKPGTKLNWNFGDKSNLHDTGVHALHYYKTPGLYDVTVTVDGKRQETRLINILPAPVVVNPAVITVNFKVPEKILVDQPAIFKDFTREAHTWEWDFNEDGVVDKTTREAKYTFRTSGWKNVKLRVNGSNDRITKVYVSNNISQPSPQPVVITVKPGPVSPPIQVTKTDSPKITTDPVPVKPKAPPVTNEQLKGLFKQVVDGSKKASDFALYIEPNRNITVYLNGKGMTLNMLCQKLREIGNAKKIKELTITHIEKNENNYITTLNIKLDTKGIFGGKY